MGMAAGRPVLGEGDEVAVGKPLCQNLGSRAELSEVNTEIASKHSSKAGEHCPSSRGLALSSH